MNTTNNTTIKHIGLRDGTKLVGNYGLNAVAAIVGGAAAVGNTVATVLVNAEEGTVTHKLATGHYKSTYSDAKDYVEGQIASLVSPTRDIVADAQTEEFEDESIPAPANEAK